MLYFIVNPTSSSGRGLQQWTAVEQELKARQAAYEVFLLDAAGDAANVASFLSSQKRPCTIVVVGGDGTLNEVVNGLGTFQQITLGNIPTGSGNDFARALKLPEDPSAAAQMLLNPSRKIRVNVGRTASEGSSRRFIVSSGIGFDAAVCHVSVSSGVKSALNKAHMGQMIYTANALALLSRLQPSGMRIILDDREFHSFDHVLFAAAMNTKYEGGGYKFCPGANPTDGQLDLIVIDGIPKHRVPLLLPKARSGKHIHEDGVHIFRCSRAVLTSETPLAVHTDGENAGVQNRVTFSLEPERISVIIK